MRRARLGKASPGAQRKRDRRAAPRTRVLLVDDETVAARALAELLRLWGHEVRAAADGPSALKAAAAFRPEVVLLDIGLPGMDGLTVARELRRLEGTASSLIVALTGLGREEDQGRSRAAGIDLHMTKPMDAPSLRRLLAQRIRSAADGSPSDDDKKLR